MRSDRTKLGFLWNYFEKPPPTALRAPARPLIIWGLGCNHTQV